MNAIIYFIFVCPCLCRFMKFKKIIVSGTPNLLNCYLLPISQYSVKTNSVYNITVFYFIFTHILLLNAVFYCLLA